MKARKEYMDSLQTLQDAKEMLATEDDPEMKEMAREEMAATEKHIPEMEERIKLLLVPADPEDDKNVIMEIRGGTEETKPHCSQATCSACTPNIAK